MSDLNVIPHFNSVLLKMPVEDVKLRLQMDGAGQELSYDTYVVVFPQRRSEGAQWTEPAEQEDLICLQRCIPSRMSAVIVAVVEEPLLKISAAVTVSGSVLYTIHESPQDIHILDLLPADIQFRVEELVEGSLRPFSSCQESVEGATEADLVSAVVTSGMWKLRVSSRHNLSAPLQPSDCGLQRVPPLPPHCWVGRNSGSLAGMVVIHRQVSGLEHQLELYARDVKQALQLVHMLRSSWRVEECRDCGVSVSDCVRSLAAELRVLHNVFQPAAQISPERWAEIRKQLTSLELTADLAFSEYSSRN